MLAAGIECGDGGRSDCGEDYTTAGSAALQAIPSAGYRFLAWGGHCSGDEPLAEVLVDRAKRCLAVFAPIPDSGAPPDPTLNVATALVFRFGSAGPRRTELWTVQDSTFGWSSASPSQVMVSLGSSITGAQFSRLLLSENGPLAPGDYDADPRPCPATAGRYRIYELAYDAGGQITRFAADFEAVCQSSTEPHLVGAIRINSTRASSVPFDGEYPLVRLTIDPAANGIVTGPGVDCGAGHADCRETYDAPADITLQAIPLREYRFAGWTAECDGAAALSMKIDRMRRCAAVFDVAVAGQRNHRSPCKGSGIPGRERSG